MNKNIKKTALCALVSLLSGTISCMDMPNNLPLPQLNTASRDIKDLIVSTSLNPYLCYDWKFIQIEPFNPSEPIYDKNLIELQPFHLLSQHSISTAALSLDRRTAVAIINGQANLINTMTGSIHGTFAEYYQNLSHIALSANGEVALLVNSSQTAHFWDTTTNKPLGNPFQVDPQLVIDTVALFPNGKKALLGLHGGTFSSGYLKIWDRETGEIVDTPSFSSNIKSIAISDNEQFVVIGLSKGDVYLFNVQTKALTHFSTACEREGYLSCVALSPEGELAFAGYSTNLVGVWCTKTGKLINSFTAEGDISSIQCSPDGYSVLVTTDAKNLQLFDALEGICLKKLIALEDESIPFATFATGQIILALASNGEPFIWKLQMEDTSWKQTRHKTAEALSKKLNLHYMFAPTLFSSEGTHQR